MTTNEKQYGPFAANGAAHNTRMAPRLELFPFRFRDPVTGKWVRARYRAERHEIAARYVQWEITGPGEIRDIDPRGALRYSGCVEALGLSIPQSVLVRADEVIQ